MLRLEQLRYFVMAVEKGSLNKAAKALYVSQPALTKQLAQMESELSCVLFYRRNTGIELTEAGRFFYEKASMILEQLDQTVQGMKQFSTQETLRIGALPSISTYYLPNAINRLEQERGIHTSIAVRDTTAELIRLLEQGEIDLAFVQDAVGHPEFLTHTLFHEPYQAVLPSDHALAAEKTVDFLALCQEKLLLHRDPCDIRSNVRRHCNRLGIQPAATMELEFSESLLTFTAKGYGITVLPSMVAAHIYDPRLVIKEIDPHSFTRSVDIIYQPRFEQEAEVLSQEAHRTN